MKNKIWNRFEIFTGFEPILVWIKSKNYKKYQKNCHLVPKWPLSAIFFDRPTPLRDHLVLRTNWFSDWKIDPPTGSGVWYLRRGGPPVLRHLNVTCTNDSYKYYIFIFNDVLTHLIVIQLQFWIEICR